MLYAGQVHVIHAEHVWGRKVYKTGLGERICIFGEAVREAAERSLG